MKLFSSFSLPLYRSVLTGVVFTLIGCSNIRDFSHDMNERSAKNSVRGIQRSSIECDFVAVSESQWRNQNGLGSVKQGALKPVPLNNLNVIDNNIRNKIVAQRLGLRLLDNGQTQVEVVLANCTDFPLQADVRTQFIGNQHETSPWQRVFLSPRSLSFYQEQTLSDQFDGMVMVDLKEGR